METLLHSCVKVCELSDQAVVWDGEWAGLWVGVLDRGPHCLRGREVLGLFHSHWFEWRIFKTNVFDSCVKSCSQYFHMDNMSLETSVCWLYEDVVSFKIQIGLYKKFAKM